MAIITTVDRADLALLGAMALALFFLPVDRPSQASDIDAPTVTQSRVCAAAEVYQRATADDWSQRAAIAQATLNRYQRAGVADCGAALSRLVGSTRFDRIRWQSALDAVDAVASGSYHLPLACARADTVIPLTSGLDLPPGRPAARVQCVIDGLAFAEAQP